MGCISSICSMITEKEPSKKDRIYRNYMTECQMCRKTIVFNDDELFQVCPMCYHHYTKKQIITKNLKEQDIKQAYI